MTSLFWFVFCILGENNYCTPCLVQNYKLNALCTINSCTKTNFLFSLDSTLTATQFFIIPSCYYISLIIATIITMHNFFLFTVFTFYELHKLSNHFIPGGTPSKVSTQAELTWKNEMKHNYYHISINCNNNNSQFLCMLVGFLRKEVINEDGSDGQQQLFFKTVG